MQGLQLSKQFCGEVPTNHQAKMVKFDEVSTVQSLAAKAEKPVLRGGVVPSFPKREKPGACVPTGLLVEKPVVRMIQGSTTKALVRMPSTAFALANPLEKPQIRVVFPKAEKGEGGSGQAILVSNGNERKEI